MSGHSFTDEQLLQLVNSTIDDSENDIDYFTGGTVQITSTYKNKIITYKIMLFFGYDKNKNPITYSEEIEEEYYFLWSEAIMLKVHSLNVSKTGTNFSKMNERMNRQNDNRNESSTTSTIPLPITSTKLPTTSLPMRKPKKFNYPKEFEFIWHNNRKGDKWKAYRAYFNIKDEYSQEILQKALQIEALKTYGRRDASTVFNGDIEDLLLQEQSIKTQQTFKSKEPEVGSIAWRMQQEQNEIDVEVVDVTVT